MATTAPTANEYNAARLLDSIFLLHEAAAATVTLAAHAPVAVSAAATGPDTTLRALGGVIELGAGDSLYMTFAKSGTVTTPTFLLGQWRPIRGTDGSIVGYSEFALNDVGSSLTYGTFAIGALFVSVAMADGTQPAAAAIPAGTEVYAKAITCNVNTVPVSNSVVLNNLDLIKVTDDAPCILRYTPADGATHLRVQQQDTGAGGGKMLCFAWRGRGLALNR